MPASLTHYTFVKENINANDYYKNVIELGGQGPDVFFFYGYSLIKRKNIPEIQSFGTLLHHIDIAKSYYFLLKYAKNNEHKKLLLSYIKGLFMHYVLDRNIHPYVFYRTGFSSDKEKKKDFSLSHVAFETILDVYFSREHHTFNKPSKYIHTKKKYVRIISKMFYELAKHLNIPFINENSFYLAYKDMRTSQKMLFSRFGIKKYLFNKYMHNTIINAMSMPMKVEKYDSYDFLNKDHNEWADCVYNTKRHESINDLYHNAINELSNLDKILEKTIVGTLLIEDVESFIHGIDHDGFSIKAKKKYYKLLWK